MAMKLVMTKGLPGSGKTRYARELCDKEPGKWKLVDKDSLRTLLDNGKWSKGNENFVLKVRDFIVITALQEGKNVIVHDTNLEPVHEETLRAIAKDFNAEFEIKDFTDVPLEICIKNDLKRFDSVGEAVIRKMHSKYLAEAPLPAPEKIEDAPDAIIVDLDGTLAIIGDRSPYDASQCHLDELNEMVAWVIERWQAVYETPTRAVILMSGRQEKDRQATETWLEKHHIEYDELFMRATDDIRNDAIVKRELYEQHVLGNYNIDLVIDDRQRVVDAWRSLGLTCWQVAAGSF